jgi:predicted nicotinamide N-methyase
MEKLPKVEQSFKTIFDMCLWSTKEKVLDAGLKLGIFNVLSEPISAEAVSRTIGTHPKNTGLFLDGLTAIDLVKKEDGLYQNTPVSQAFLVETSPTFLGSIFMYLLTKESFTADDLLNLVKEGPFLPDKVHTASDEMTEEEVATYIPFQRAGRAQRIAEIASSLPEFASSQKMLDLGCGPGLNGIATVSEHPTMRGISFDRPRTIEVAKKTIREYGMEDRMETISGNYTRDPIGEEYDLILACDTLYYTRDEIDPIMSKLYDALNSGGVFISIHHGLTSERTKPEDMVLGMLFSGLKGEDMGLLDNGFIVDAILRAGFRSVRSRTIDSDWGKLNLDIGWK